MRGDESNRSVRRGDNSFNPQGSGRVSQRGVMAAVVESVGMRSATTRGDPNSLHASSSVVCGLLVTLSNLQSQIKNLSLTLIMVLKLVLM